MRGLEIMNMQAILDGGEARTSELEYARQLASQAATYTDESTEIDHNDDGSYTVRLVSRALLDAAKALRTGMVREVPEPGVTIWSTPLNVRGEAREATARMERETREFARRQLAVKALACPHQAPGYHSTALGVPLADGMQRVGVYELVIGEGDVSTTDKYRRWEIRSAPATIGNEADYGDALIEIVATEKGLLFESLFVMFRADLFEAENRERIL